MTGTVVPVPADQPNGRPAAATVTSGLFREMFPALAWQVWLDTPASAGRDAGDGRAGIGGRRLAGGLPRRGGLGGRRAAGTGRLRALPWRAGSACRPDGLGRRGRRHGRRVSARPRWHCRGRRRRVPQQPVFLAGPGGQGVPDHPCSRWRDPYGVPVGRSRLSSSRAPRPGRPSGVAARSASPSPEPVSTRLDCGACEGTEQTRPQQVQTCEGLAS
jgi:hypothetical protein